MTDGTSQGLFIVVAIVIFGIFTLMAYILFEDTLSPALAGMFTEATEQSSKRLNKSLITAADFKDWEYFSETYGEIVKSDRFVNNGSSIILDNGPRTKGIVLSETTFEPNKDYVLTFDSRVLSGTVNNLGGHLAISTDTKVYVDGKLIEGDWHVINFGSYPNDKEKHSIRVEFNSNRYHAPIASNTGNVTWDKAFYIQPNRYNTTFHYSIEFDNFRLTEK